MILKLERPISQETAYNQLLTVLIACPRIFHAFILALLLEKLFGFIDARLHKLLMLTTNE